MSTYGLTFLEVLLPSVQGSSVSVTSPKGKCGQWDTKRKDDLAQIKWLMLNPWLEFTIPSASSRSLPQASKVVQSRGCGKNPVRLEKKILERSCIFLNVKWGRKLSFANIWQVNSKCIELMNKWMLWMFQNLLLIHIQKCMLLEK